MNSLWLMPRVFTRVRVASIRPSSYLLRCRTTGCWHGICCIRGLHGASAWWCWWSEEGIADCGADGSESSALDAVTRAAGNVFGETHLEGAHAHSYPQVGEMRKDSW